MGEFRAVGQFEQEVGQFEQVSREAAKQNKAVDYTQRSTEVMDNEPLSSEVMDNEPLTSEVMDNEPLSTDDEEYDTTYNEEYSDEEATTPTPLASPAACSSPIVTAEMPQAILCPYCLEPVVTVIEKKPGKCMWLAVVLLGVTTLGLCAWIPCCIDTCKDTRHSCPSCQATIDTVKLL